MFRFLKNLFDKQPGKLMPEALWHTGILDGSLWSSDAEGTRRSVPVDSLRLIAIETNDSGPWGADVWWLFFGEEEALAVAFPQGATGEQDVLDVVMGLRGFDHQATIDAMASTSNALFKVWERN